TQVPVVATGLSSRLRVFSRVVLPEPLGPSMATCSFCAMVREKSRSTQVDPRQTVAWCSSIRGTDERCSSMASVGLANVLVLQVQVQVPGSRQHDHRPPCLHVMIPPPSGPCTAHHGWS